MISIKHILSNALLWSTKNTASFIAWRYTLALIFVMMLYSSCSNTKFLKDDEKLYTRTWFEWKGKKKVERLPFKAYDVVMTGYVRTNWNYVTFSRSGLAFYNYTKPKKTWGIRHYIWSVMSKPPVLVSQVNPEARLVKMQQGLFDMGHFDSEVNLSLKYKGKDNKRVQAVYSLNMRRSYHFRNYDYFAHSCEIDKYIKNSLIDSYIKTGDEYWLFNVKNERQRVTDVLRNEGYFFFKPDYFIFDMDTTVGNKEIDAALKVKSEVPSSKKQKYTISTVNVFFDSNRDSIGSVDLIYDTANHVFFQKQDFYRQKYVNRSISMEKDSLFRLSHHRNTTSYIGGFGIFKQNELIYTIDSSKTNALNANLFLSPIKPIAISLELNFATKSNDFLGPAAILSISHANIFRGAERLSLQIDGGFEWQKASKRKEYKLGLNSFEVGVKAILEFPRFLLPFKLKKQSKKHIPKTYAILGYKLIQRVKYYEMSLSQVNFGYKWTADNNLKWKIEPLTFNFISMLGKSKEFTDYLIKYPSVARSFNEQFILGSTYSLTVERIKKRNIFKNYYNNITIDMAGNLVNMLSTTKDKVASGSPDLLLGANYSQYIKFTNDFRHYLHISPVQKLVTRLLIGVGLPYNNSQVLPYIKQYFAGGSNDLRAFYARTVGPGSYKKDYTQTNLLLDQSGEIKIVGNIEYRFPITYKLEGALFLDAGNVWLLNEDTSRAGGKFSFNSFAKELAVGAGIGFRVNLDYVTMRLDASIPLRRPYKESAKYWTFSSPYFVRDYILTFAIGYPF
ncbi:MAG: BamA/TamA family outer membrane protein [Bacteroidales bacterium]|nr:BamA/TamA family outer membrane protein [Bacteroidales bacterium]